MLIALSFASSSPVLICEIMSAIKPGQSIGVFVGPEGGFAPDEIEGIASDAHRISLGRRILRTETAGLAILSVLMFQLEKE